MSHLRDVVHPHRLDTLGILVAQREPCLRIATESELKQSGRRFQRVDAVGPSGLPESWCMAVLLCPGDDTKALAEWATTTGAETSRVHFYLHKDTDPRRALAAWHRAGHAIPSTWDVATWKDLARNFGAKLNQQTHDDHCTDSKCPLR